MALTGENHAFPSVGQRDDLLPQRIGGAVGEVERLNRAAPHADPTPDAPVRRDDREMGMR